MGIPSGGRGPSWEKDRNSTGRSGRGSRRGRAGGRGGERGEEGGRGGGCDGQREQWEDPLATHLDGEIELRQTSRGAGGVCVGIVPWVRSKLSRAFHTYREKTLLQDLQTVASAVMNRAMITFKVMQEEGAMVFVECPEVSQEDTMDGHLLKERQEPGVARRGETYWWVVSRQ